jgi:hypothetical protein
LNNYPTRVKRKPNIARHFEQSSRYWRLGTQKCFSEANFVGCTKALTIRKHAASNEISNLITPELQFQGHEQMAEAKEMFVSMTIADGTQSPSLVKHYSVVLERYVKLLTNHGVKQFIKRPVLFRTHGQRDENCNIGD